MEETEAKREPYSIREIMSKALHVFKRHWHVILGMTLAMWLLSYWSNLFMVSTENPVPRVLVSIAVALLDNSLMIVLLLMVYKTIKGQVFAELLPTIKRSVMPYIITMWIIRIIVGFLMVITGLCVSGLTLSFKNPMLTMAITSMALVPVALYFYVRYAFVLPLVVLEEKYYANALNISEKMSEGYKKTIMGIQVFPVIASVAVTFLIRELQFAVSVEAFVSGGLNVLADVYSAIAVTILYFYIRE